MNRVGSPGASDGVVVRIATLNCLNLTLAGHAPYAEVAAPTESEYQARLNWLAQMFRRLDADFTLVQEVFHEEALAAAVAKSGLPLACRAPLAGDDNTRPRLGLVWHTRWQPQIESISAFPAGCEVVVPEAGSQRTFSRPLLRASVVLGPSGAHRLTLLNLHLKSRRPVFAAGETEEDPRARARGELRALVVRGAEAAAARSLVLESLAAGDALVVGGDFNACSTAVTTGIVTGASTAGPGPATGADVLHDALVIAGTAGSGPTYIDNGAGERIDHLFVSSHFSPPGSGGRILRVETFAEHLVAAASPVGPGPAPARIESDHAAVCLTLALAPE